MMIPYQVRLRLSRLGARMLRLLRAERRRPARAADPFATHLPVLVALGTILPLRRVVEFGCGRCSTLSFLDRGAFPDLVRLDSFEDDPAWLRQVADAAGHDPRLRLELVPSPVSVASARVSLDGYDLIFIDDSTRWQDRAATIRQVAERCGDSALIVIHDYEFQPYRETASLLPNRFEFKALNPATGLAWKKAPIDRGHLRHLNALIEHHAGEIEPGDVHRWVETLSVARLAQAQDGSPTRAEGRPGAAAAKDSRSK